MAMGITTRPPFPREETLPKKKKKKSRSAGYKGHTHWPPGNVLNRFPPDRPLTIADFAGCISFGNTFLERHNNPVYKKTKLKQLTSVYDKKGGGGGIFFLSV